MKRLSKMFILLSTIFLMAGCAKQSVHMDIKNDGKITLSAIFAYAESASSYGMEVTDEQKKEYAELGYKVEDYKEDDMVGVKISKTYHIKEVSSKDPVEVHLEKVGSSAFKDDVLFQSVGNNSYKANFIIDTKVDYDSTLSSVAEQFDISYSVTLPSAPKSHNADLVDGNTLTWKVTYGEIKNINYEFSLSGNTLFYTILGTVVIIGVIVGIIVLVKNNRNKSNPNGMMNSMQPNSDVMTQTSQPSMMVTSSSDVSIGNVSEPVNSSVVSQENIVVPTENSTVISGNEQVVNETVTVSNETSVESNENISQEQ